MVRVRCAPKENAVAIWLDTIKTSADAQPDTGFFVVPEKTKARWHPLRMPSVHCVLCVHTGVKAAGECA
jgi:hypothetical protein